MQRLTEHGDPEDLLRDLAAVLSAFIVATVFEGDVRHADVKLCVGQLFYAEAPVLYA